MDEYLLKMSELLNKRSESVLDIIDEIIDKFSEKYFLENPGMQQLDEKLKYEIITSIFMEGSCYYFAHMLNKIFENNSKIYICTSDDIHAIVRIDGSFYDAQGNLEAPYNRKGFKRSYVDTSKYKEATKEDYDLLVDLCYIGRNKENFKCIERICDEVLDEIIPEQPEKTVKH